MARAKKTTTASRRKKTPLRTRKSGGRVSVTSKVETPKKAAGSKPTPSRRADPKPIVVKSSATKSGIVKSETTATPARTRAVEKGSSRRAPVGVGAAASARAPTEATGRTAGPKTSGRTPKTDKDKTGAAETGTLPLPASRATPAHANQTRNSETQGTKWTGEVIRVPALPKGQKVKSNRAKAASRSDGGPSVTAHDPIQFPEESTAVPRTPLTDAQLREFKELLLHKRAELCGDVLRLTDEALNRGSDGLKDQSSMPIHMADLGTDNWEQEFTLGLIANEQAVVREIDQALERIFAKTYGVCLATHTPIGIARLRAKPWAKYCIEYARAREEGRAN